MKEIMKGYVAQESLGDRGRVPSHWVGPLIRILPLSPNRFRLMIAHS